jgi:SAM-dependent methyltransferase
LKLLDQAIAKVARARAPKEPPMPAGPDVGGHPLLERPLCPGCGNTRAKLVVEGNDTWVADAPEVGPRKFSVVRCEVCALRYTTPRFKREHRHHAFAGAYPFYLRARQAKAGAEIDRRAARAPFEGRADRVTAAHPIPGRLLDIGGGDGYFGDLMRERGWEVVTLDLEPDVVAHAKDHLGLDARVCDVEVDPLPEGPFDVITAWGVLQLLYAPRRALERILSLLSRDGLLAIGVSNIRSAGLELFGERWRGLGLPRHLSHFSPETLSRLLEWSGYEIARIHYDTPKWIVAGSIDDALPKLARAPARAALYALRPAVSSSRYGDTFEIHAQVGDRSPRQL